MLECVCSIVCAHLFHVYFTFSTVSNCANTFKSFHWKKICIKGYNIANSRMHLRSIDVHDNGICITTFLDHQSCKVLLHIKRTLLLYQSNKSYSFFLTLDQMLLKWFLQRSPETQKFLNSVSHSGLQLLEPETRPASKFTSK